MFKSLDSIASVVGIFMYLTISKFKQVPRSQKGIDYNTDRSVVFSQFSNSQDLIFFLFYTTTRIMITFFNTTSMRLLQTDVSWSFVTMHNA